METVRISRGTPRSTPEKVALLLHFLAVKIGFGIVIQHLFNAVLQLGGNVGLHPPHGLTAHTGKHGSGPQVQQLAHGGAITSSDGLTAVCHGEFFLVTSVTCLLMALLISLL